MDDFNFYHKEAPLVKEQATLIYKLQMYAKNTIFLALWAKN